MKIQNMTAVEKYDRKEYNTYRRFLREARKKGAVRFQRSYHGCDRYSAQGFDADGKCVCDWNL